ncbi:MAG: WecB/TagA/CpsF family glycosyltransferase [Gammaproteobacteria bacterium]|nr:WecB/TagA/CpsF family glycosyltransferase [Gammaproteobacteria bacterium]
MIDEPTCVEHFATAADSGQGIWVVTANADIARLCQHDAELAQLVAGADLIVADGMPLVWASRLLGHALPERVCGSDLVWSLAERAAQDGFKLFLLGGGTPSTAARAATILQERFPALEIAGTHFPPFGFESDPGEMERIEEAVRDASAALVYVALGFPKAEKLIASLLDKFPAVSWIGVGISLSFICGEVPRAPKWMQHVGLEWIHRLAQEPRRLAMRYLWHDIPFTAKLLASAIWARVKKFLRSER